MSGVRQKTRTDVEDDANRELAAEGFSIASDWCVRA